MKKQFVRVVALGMAALQLAGCIIPQALVEAPDTLLGGAGVRPISGLKGAFSPAQRAQAEIASSYARAAHGGVVGYSESEYQRRYSAFRQAKDVYKSAGSAVTESQFLQLTTSLRDVLVYVDMVEAGTPAVARVDRKAAISGGSYSIPPGGYAEFSFNGLCLDADVPQPAKFEPLQLVPDDQVWGANLPVYRRLMAGKPNLAPIDPAYANGSNFYAHGLGDYQVAVWALHELQSSGVIKSDRTRALSPAQKQLLVDAGVPRLKLEASLAVGDVYGGALKSLGDVAGKSLPGGMDIPQVQRGLGMALSGRVTPAEILSSPAVLNNPQALEQHLGQWLAARNDSPVTTAAGALDQYSVLAPSVVAKAVSADRLSGSFRIANLSDQSFSFQPDLYAVNARSNTQPVALARVGVIESGPAYTVRSGSGKGAIPGALLDDLDDLAQDRLLDALVGDEGLIPDLKTAFKSKTVRSLLGAIPVVGNLISLGTILTGTNLDGSPMSGLDYAEAALGVLPVVGNLARAGIVGGRATSGLVAAMNSRGAEVALGALETSIAIAQTKTGQEIPGWMSERFEEASGRVASFAHARG